MEVEKKMKMKKAKEEVEKKSWMKVTMDKPADVVASLKAARDALDADPTYVSADPEINKILFAFTKMKEKGMEEIAMGMKEKEMMGNANFCMFDDKFDIFGDGSLVPAAYACPSVCRDLVEGIHLDSVCTQTIEEVIAKIAPGVMEKVLKATNDIFAAQKAAKSMSDLLAEEYKKAGGDAARPGSLEVAVKAASAYIPVLVAEAIAAAAPATSPPTPPIKLAPSN